MIVAYGRNRVIGVGGDLPWHLPDDLRWFKAATIGKPVVMGRKTYDAMGKALPKRPNIVITRNPEYEAAGCLVVHSLQAALDIARESGEDEAFITGGREVFAQALETADRIYLTRVHMRRLSDVALAPVPADSPGGDAGRRLGRHPLAVRRGAE